MGKKSTVDAQLAAVLVKGKKNRKKGKKGRKIGRYAKHLSSQRYKAERRWEKNKVIRIERHLKKYPRDGQAKAALSRAREAVGGVAVRARAG